MVALHSTAIPLKYSWYTSYSSPGLFIYTIDDMLLAEVVNVFRIVATSKHDGVIIWQHFRQQWPFVRWIHRSPVDSPKKGQRRGVLMFSLMRAWTNGWENNRDAGDLRRHGAHCDVAVIRETGTENNHYSDIIMSAMISSITNLTIIYWTVYSGADQIKHQTSASLAFVRGMHRWPVNSPHRGSVTRKMFSFDDVIMQWVNA